MPESEPDRLPLSWDDANANRIIRTLGLTRSPEEVNESAKAWGKAYRKLKAKGSVRAIHIENMARYMRWRHRNGFGPMTGEGQYERSDQQHSDDARDDWPSAM